MVVALIEGDDEQLKDFKSFVEVGQAGRFRSFKHSL